MVRKKRSLSREQGLGGGVFINLYSAVTDHEEEICAPPKYVNDRIYLITVGNTHTGEKGLKGRRGKRERESFWCVSLNRAVRRDFNAKIADYAVSR